MKKLIVLILMTFTSPLWSAEVYSKDVLISQQRSSQYIPWHYYYYPKKSQIAFASKNSALQKLARLMPGSSGNSLISEYKDRFFKPNAYNWEGICHLMLQASIKKKLRGCPISFAGEEFTLEDQRFLLALLFSNESASKFKIFGTRGKSQENDTFSALDFHKFLLDYFLNPNIKDPRPFGVDKSPDSTVIWEPVYSVKVDIKKTYNVPLNGSNVEEYFIRTTLRKAKHLFEYSPSKLKEKKSIVDETTYTYILKAQRLNNNKIKIVSADWTSNSLRPGLAIIYGKYQETFFSRFSSSISKYVPEQLIEKILDSPCLY